MCGCIAFASQAIRLPSGSSLVEQKIIVPNHTPKSILRAVSLELVSMVRYSKNSKILLRVRRTRSSVSTIRMEWATRVLVRIRLHSNLYLRCTNCRQDKFHCNSSKDSVINSTLAVTGRDDGLEKSRSTVRAGHRYRPVLRNENQSQPP
jgi:hypothetical protein